MANVRLVGTVLTGAGVAVVGATVEVFDRDTTTPVRATFTGGTDANGDWNFSYAPGANSRRVDVRITNGTSISFLKQDDEIQVASIETEALRILNPNFDFEYDIVPAAITAARALNLPLLTGTGTIAVLENVVSGGQTFAGAITFSLAGSAVTISGATGNTLVVDTNVLVVDATNNRVGFGTASPDALAHLSASVSSGPPAAGQPLRIVNTNAGNGAAHGIYFLNSSATAGAGSIELESSTGGNGRFYWSTVQAAGALTARMNLGLGLQVGAPTGGDKGTGTINATAVYDDNVLLTDWIFDQHYGSVIDRGMPAPKDGRLWSLSETAQFTQAYHRLPWMPCWEQFENERSLGKMVTNLWQGQEYQQLHLYNHEERLEYLESENRALRQEVRVLRGG